MAGGLKGFVSHVISYVWELETCRRMGNVDGNCRLNPCGPVATGEHVFINFLTDWALQKLGFQNVFRNLSLSAS